MLFHTFSNIALLYVCNITHQYPFRVSWFFDILPAQSFAILIQINSFLIRAQSIFGIFCQKIPFSKAFSRSLYTKFVFHFFHCLHSLLLFFLLFLCLKNLLSFCLLSLKLLQFILLGFFFLGRKWRLVLSKMASVWSFFINNLLKTSSFRNDFW